MSSPKPLRSSAVPTEAPIVDFTWVAHDGRQLLVGVDFFGRALSWDPVPDVWREHDLDDPFPMDDDESPGIELTAFGAMVVDGRIVVGGGGQHQSFAQWDLETGAVRGYADEGTSGPEAVTVVDLDGREHFLVGDDTGRAAIWDPALVAERDPDITDDDEELRWEYDTPEPVTVLGETNLDGTLGLAAGTLDGAPIAVIRPFSGTVTSWDLAAEAVAATFPPVPAAGRGLAVTELDGRATVVIATGDAGLLLGDPGTGTWNRTRGAAAETDDATVTCLAAAAGRAVTGAADGTLRVWRLSENSPPTAIPAHDGAITAVAVTELDGDPVAVTVGRDALVRLWPL